MAYNPQEIESKWQSFWENNKTFRAEIDTSKEKYYALDMFPYPSAAGLHVGHPEGYTATDITSRYKRMKGYNVLHCMGWDAFGLPAEQHALQTGTHPAETTQKNVNTFKRQIKSLGFSYDWDREINTTDPKYYKWTQWIFMQIYKQGLAYQNEAPVNWCPALGTVLANEEVVNGVSERGGHPVERRAMKQWMLKITEYAEKLLTDLEEVDWADSIKEMQRNWIGKSHGARARFAIAGHDKNFDIFTTRPDTLFGATYCVFSPEHPLVAEITTADQKEQIEAYVKDCSLKSELDRTDLAKEKTGVFTGAYAINPVNNKEIPIWIADYVMMSYGTGAIMAVPGHDVRDHEFAMKFNLPIIQVVSGVDSVAEEAFPGEGTSMNSDFLDGLKTAESKEKIINWLEEKGLGEGTINYKLRDWLFSRQRYWGEPFPLVETEDGEVQLIEESELPLLLPETENYKPSPNGESPLANVEEWINITLSDGSKGKRNSNTMPQWAGSCWYYLRFTDPNNENEAWSKEAEKYWMPVDLYIGGAEHAVLHLLYSRFWHKVLYDQGHVSTKEPFKKLVNQGMILGEDGRKMSKSIGNVINPDDIVKKYGADSMRLYEMFMGPLQKEKPWQTNGLEGVHKFLSKIWNLIVTESGDLQSSIQEIDASETQLKILHKTIKKVSQDTEELKFNTAISQMMIFLNEINSEKIIAKSVVKTFVLLLAPYAPHLAEELWSKLGGSDTLSYEIWPEHDESLTQENEFEVPIQINGKLRDKIMMPVGLSQDEAYKLAEASSKIQKYVDGKTIRKVIFIKNRILNIVVS